MTYFPQHNFKRSSANSILTSITLVELYKLYKKTVPPGFDLVGIEPTTLHNEEDTLATAPKGHHIRIYRTLIPDKPDQNGVVLNLNIV